MEVEASACRSTSGIDNFRLLNGGDPKIAASPLKIKIILKPFKKATEDVPAVPPATLSEDSMKLKFETTKSKLEQRYGEEAEKKVKKKIQRMDFADSKKNVGGGGGGCSKVKAGNVRERLLAKMKKMKQKNKKPKYTLYSNKIVMENSFNDDHEVSFVCIP